MTAAASLQQIGAYSISRTLDGGLAEGRVVTVQTGRTSADNNVVIGTLKQPSLVWLAQS
jgi:hypothetical protein